MLRKAVGQFFSFGQFKHLEHLNPITDPLDVWVFKGLLWIVKWLWCQFCLKKKVDSSHCQPVYHHNHHHHCHHHHCHHHCCCICSFLPVSPIQFNYQHFHNLVITKQALLNKKVLVLLYCFVICNSEGMNCGYDYVAVYEGTNSSGRLIGKFCGTTAPSPLSALGAMYIQFWTDSSVVRGGFRAMYT